MAITRTDLQNMARAATQGAGREAGEVLAGAAREFGQSNLAAKRLREQMDLNRQGMALRERLADLEERQFEETLPLKKQQLQAEIDKTRQYMDYLDKTLSMRQKELDFSLGKESRDFTRSLFGLGYGTPEERGGYLTEETEGAFSVGPGGYALGTSPLLGGAGNQATGTAAGGGMQTVGSMPLGGWRSGMPGGGGFAPIRAFGRANTSQSLASSGTRGKIFK